VIGPLHVRRSPNAMTSRNMHADQIPTDAGLVRRLLEAQFPEWAGLAIEPFASDGTSNAIYRLGDHLAARMPLQFSPAKTEQIEKEHHWLPGNQPGHRALGPAHDS